MILVDANVWIDLIGDDQPFAAWSRRRVEDLADRRTLALNPLILAEVLVGVPDASSFEAALEGLGVERLPLPFEAASGAARAFSAYRRRGGARRAPLPDFYIGAHAEAGRLALLTRDVARFRTYFPRVSLIAPDTHP